MSLFRHRPLFLCCFVFFMASVLGMALFYDQSHMDALRRGLIAGAILLGGTAVMVAYTLLRRRSRRATILVGCAALFALMALGRSFSTFSGTQAAFLRDKEYETVTVCGVITDRRGQGGYLTSLSIELDTVDGQEFSAMALLTCHYLSDLRPGDLVEAEVSVLPLSEAAGEGYDALALRGDGYVAGLLSEDEDTVTLLESDVQRWSVRSGQVRRTLAARLNILVGKDAGGLPSALFLNETGSLDGSVRRDFARSGTSHVLAISGMHMTLLFGMLEVILRTLRVPRRARVLLLGIGAVVYLFITGFAPSASRAIVMLGMVYLSVFASSRADPITSLGIAGLVILLVTPYAVSDAGFWMSMLATFGMVTLSPLTRTYTDDSRQKGYAKSGRLSLTPGVPGFFKSQITTIVVGIVAMTLTLFVVAGVIGEFGVLSPVGTLLLTPLSAIVLIASPLALLFNGNVIGTGLAAIASIATNWMLNLTEWMARPSWAVISLRHPAILPIAIGIAVAFFILLCLRLPARRQWVILLPILVGWIAIGGVCVADNLRSEGEVSGAYLQPSTQSDMVVLVSGQHGVILDLSNGGLTSMRAAADEAHRQGATEIAVLILTHYHSRTMGTLADFFAGETVRAMWLPKPENEEEYQFMEVYIERAVEAGVTVSVYEEGQELSLFDGRCLMLHRSRLKRSAQPVLLAAMIEADGEDAQETMVYCGASVFESDLSELASSWVEKSDVVIYGHHGPLVKEPFGTELSYRDDADIILSGVGDEARFLCVDALPADAEIWLGAKMFWE